MRIFGKVNHIIRITRNLNVYSETCRPTSLLYNQVQRTRMASFRLARVRYYSEKSKDINNLSNTTGDILSPDNTTVESTASMLQATGGKENILPVAVINAPSINGASNPGLKILVIPINLFGGDEHAIRQTLNSLYLLKKHVGQIDAFAKIIELPNLKPVKSRTGAAALPPNVKSKIDTAKPNQDPPANAPGDAGTTSTPTPTNPSSETTALLDDGGCTVQLQTNDTQYQSKAWDMQTDADAIGKVFQPYQDPVNSQPTTHTSNVILDAPSPSSTTSTPTCKQQYTTTTTTNVPTVGAAQPLKEQEDIKPKLYIRDKIETSDLELKENFEADADLEDVTKEIHTYVPEELEEKLKDMAISSMQLAFEMDMTNIRDAIIQEANSKSANPRPKLQTLRDPTVSLTTNVEVEPSEMPEKTVPLNFNALIQGTVEIDASKLPNELSDIKVPEFNDNVTCIAAHICSTALQKGFPSDLSRKSYSTATEDSSNKELNPHIICTATEKMGCKSPGNAHLPKFKPRHEQDDDSCPKNMMASRQYERSLAEASKRRHALMKCKAAKRMKPTLGVLKPRLDPDVIELKDDNKRKRLEKCKRKNRCAKDDPCKDDPCKKKHRKHKGKPSKKCSAVPRPVGMLAKKKDPCKNKDPCAKFKAKKNPCKKKKKNPCKKKKSNPCKKKKKDPCKKKKKDPCKKKKADPCKKKKKDPCKKKKVDPCKKKKKDPCKKKKADPCKKKKKDPCKKKKADPCKKKKKDPCKKKKADPCKKKKKDPCKKKKKADPCKKKKKADPCKKKKKDPCKKKKRDPCKKKKRDPCKKKKKNPCKKKSDPCKKKKKDPCKKKKKASKKGGCHGSNRPTKPNCPKRGMKNFSLTSLPPLSYKTNKIKWYGKKSYSMTALPAMSYKMKNSDLCKMQYKYDSDDMMKKTNDAADYLGSVVLMKPKCDKSLGKKSYSTMAIMSTYFELPMICRRQSASMLPLTFKTRSLGPFRYFASKKKGKKRRQSGKCLAIKQKIPRQRRNIKARRRLRTTCFKDDDPCGRAKTGSCGEPCSKIRKPRKKCNKERK